MKVKLISIRIQSTRKASLIAHEYNYYLAVVPVVVVVVGTKGLRGAFMA